MNLSKILHNKILLTLLGFISISLITLTIAQLYNKNTAQQTKLHSFEEEQKSLSSKLKRAEQDYKKTLKELEALKKQDQVARNDGLQKEIADIQRTYSHAVTSYEKLIKLKESSSKTPELDKTYTAALLLLSKKNYSSASATLSSLDKNIDVEQQKIASTFAIPENVKAQNAPPGSGSSRQKVQTPVGDYLVDVIAADLNSSRVIVDTASDGTCTDNCPVDALGSYAARSGAFAGINGPYFCPASYPSCAGKANSFDTLIMNKNKVYFNSDNNVYSTVPAVIFSGNSARYVGQSLEWGRDTGVDAVIAGQPLLMVNGGRVFGGDGEPKRSGKGSRSFIGSTGSTVYIGVVHNASTAEVAYVLETMGIANALNLDSGGSTALWSGGRYIFGPGRNTPFGILLVGK